MIKITVILSILIFAALSYLVVLSILNRKIKPFLMYSGLFTFISSVDISIGSWTYFNFNRILKPLKLYSTYQDERRTIIVKLLHSSFSISSESNFNELMYDKRNNDNVSSLIGYKKGNVLTKLMQEFNYFEDTNSKSEGLIILLKSLRESEFYSKNSFSQRIYILDDCYFKTMIKETIDKISDDVDHSFILNEIRNSEFTRHLITPEFYHKNYPSSLEDPANYNTVLESYLNELIKENSSNSLLYKKIIYTINVNNQ